MKLQKMFAGVLIVMLSLAMSSVFAGNLVKNGGFEDDSVWQINDFSADGKTIYEFGVTGEEMKFGTDGALLISQGEGFGQLLIWQPLTLIGGQRYRATGAITMQELALGPDGGGTWYQIYISEEFPDETATDYNPEDDKFMDVGYGWDRATEYFDGLWETEDLGSGIHPAPYYIAPGPEGEEVEVLFGIKFGQYWADYAGANFELLVDNVGLFPVESAVNAGGDMSDETAWQINDFSADAETTYEFNVTNEEMKFGTDGALRISQGEGFGQLLIWQPVTLIGGQTYRATGAITMQELALGPDGGGTWYQVYISEEIPDETATDYNPEDDKFMDVGYGWDRATEYFDGLWETEDLGSGVHPAPYYIAPGPEGEDVEVLFGMKFGQYWADYAGTLFELLVDNVYLFPMEGDSETAVDEPAAMPDGFDLSQNYPNPFNPATQINYTVRSRDHVKLSVYDVTGQEVASLVDGVQSAGVHSVDFNAAELSSGVYFYKLETGKQSITRKMMLMK